MKASVGVFVLLVVLPASKTLAESIPDLEVGSRVRLVAPSTSPERLTGTIVRLDATALELQMADRKQPALVPRDVITKIEISHGRKSRTRGALIGALAGAAVGSIAVLATPDTSCNAGDLFECLGGPTQGEAALIVGAMGAAAGALVGSLIPPGERWQAAAARPRVSLAPRHKGVQIALSFAF